jgi:hypothetical protein
MSSLIETIEIMKEYNKKGFDVYFEGRGDGNVRAIIEAIFIINNKKNNKIVNFSI